MPAVRWRRTSCCWLPFTQIPCSPCRRNGSRFSPPGSWLCSVLLCRGGGTRPRGWIRCRCCPRSTGKPSTQRGEYTTAIEVLRDAYRSAADAGYPHMMLSCRILIGNCYSDLGRMEEMMTHFFCSGASGRGSWRHGQSGSLRQYRCHAAAARPAGKALSYFFRPLPHPSFLGLHKLAICHEQLGASGAGIGSRPTGGASGRRRDRAADAGAGTLSAGACGLPFTTAPTAPQLLDCFRQLQETYPMGFHPVPPAVGAGMVQGEPPVPPSLPPAGVSFL